MSNNDAVRIRAVFAPDARQVYGDGRPKSGDAFFAWLKSNIIDQHGRVSNPQLAVRGTEVVVIGRYRNKAGYSSAANLRLNVRNGKIASGQMLYETRVAFISLASVPHRRANVVTHVLGTICYLCVRVGQRMEWRTR